MLIQKKDIIMHYYNTTLSGRDTKKMIICVPEASGDIVIPSTCPPILIPRKACHPPRLREEPQRSLQATAW